MLSVAIALPLAGVLYLMSKHKRKRKVIFGLISPFVFVFSFYIICLIGGYICATVFKTGCAMDGYWHTELPNGYVMESIVEDFDDENLTGNIRKDKNLIVDRVSKVNVSNDTIFGETYDVNEASKEKHYFTLDSKNGNLTQYASLSDAKRYHPNFLIALTDVESSYYHSCQWVTLLGIIGFV